jgi:hypothetical protein
MSENFRTLLIIWIFKVLNHFYFQIIEKCNLNCTLGMACHLRKICFMFSHWGSSWSPKNFHWKLCIKGEPPPNNNFWLLDILHYFLETRDYCNIYLWRKVVCFVVMRSTKLGCFKLCCIFGKLLTRRGAWAWFHDIWTCSAKVLEYWNIFSLKIKLNRSWKFWRNWNVPFGILGKILMTGI